MSYRGRGRALNALGRRAARAGEGWTTDGGRRLHGGWDGLNVEADTPVHWMRRDPLRRTRTKFGAGAARSGAWTVLVDGQASNVARPSDAGIDAALTGNVCRGVPHAHFPEKR